MDSFAFRYVNKHQFVKMFFKSNSWIDLPNVQLAWINSCDSVNEYFYDFRFFKAIYLMRDVIIYLSESHHLDINLVVYMDSFFNFSSLIPVDNRVVLSMICSIPLF